MLQKRRDLAKMAATARAERQRMGFVDGGDGVTDEELIFQQFMNDMSEDEDDNGGGGGGGAYLFLRRQFLAILAHNTRKCAQGPSTVW
jgi:hypothetical protein